MHLCQRVARSETICEQHKKIVSGIGFVSDFDLFFEAPKFVVICALRRDPIGNRLLDVSRLPKAMHNPEAQHIDNGRRFTFGNVQDEPKFFEGLVSSRRSKRPLDLAADNRRRVEFGVVRKRLHEQRSKVRSRPESFWFYGPRFHQSKQGSLHLIGEATECSGPALLLGRFSKSPPQAREVSLEKRKTRDCCWIVHNLLPGAFATILARGQANFTLNFDAWIWENVVNRPIGAGAYRSAMQT